ncbi:MAG: threo-3-hydroxy-L-aspartate ammonia-lyase [Candidatus Eremiobacteraeota bacterium]|nr:threo-3-hydroxy-L-aspartate ammonia-lyase [Candidatus Eremiobacteraeota bacterium]
MTQIAQRTVSFDEVRAAAARLHRISHRTPVMTSRTLDARTGARVFLKCENFQRGGAFKFRGAYNRLAQLSAQERHSGVVTFSSGNHAQGVALAAKLLDIAATIVIPNGAPAAKVAATQEYGAQTVFYNRAEEDRDAIAQRLANERGAILVPPYDDPAIIAGQGTTALELLETVAQLDVLLVPTGGGGLLGGCAIVAHALLPQMAVYGVEPANGNDFQQSLQAGHRLKIPLPDTIADGMQTQMPGELTFPIVQDYVRNIVTVSDDEIRKAMRFVFERLKIVIEPSGASALAALLHHKVEHDGKRVGVILSGGNVDPGQFASMLRS